MKQWLRVISAWCLCAVCLLCLAPSASAAGFPDVPRTHWAYAEINEMADRGILLGSNGRFRPGDTVSRQAFLAMVCRATDLDDRGLESGDNWWQPVLAFAHTFGLCDDTEINAQNRSTPISRELAAKLLVQGFFPDTAPAPSDAAFADWEDIAPQYQPYVQTAAELSLIGGYDDQTFRPQNTLTRAAAAAMIYRALQLQEARYAPTGKTVQVPILMYHDVSYLGYGYSKTPEIFKRQMQELKNAGFQTVFFSQVIDYVEKGIPLPAKPIVITFDDGYMTNYTYVLPILQELDMKAEISIIGNAIVYANWGMNWKEVREMQASGLVSFQSHTKSLHGDYSAEGGRKGVLRAPNESWADYAQLLKQDTENILNLMEQESVKKPQVFTYPMGKFNNMAEGVMQRMGFQASITTVDGVAEVTQGKPASLQLMDRIGMDFLNGDVVPILRRYGYKS